MTDHEPLVQAQRRGSVVGLYIFEEEWFQSEEYSEVHHQFINQALGDLKKQLQTHNIPLIIKRGEALQVFNQLKSKMDLKELFSHQETGLMWTFQRDIRVKEWCQAQSIQWHEYKTFSVIRRLKSRDTWNSQRKKIIERPIHQKVQKQLQNIESNIESDDIPQVGYINPNLPVGTTSEAHRILQSFLSHRGKNYSFEMSSPNTAFESCSRLSNYITWGLISLTEIHQELVKAQREVNNIGGQAMSSWRRSLKSFESRLWWHCHFIQKLESEPEIEFENVNRAFDGMRENSFNLSHYEAWCKGETGFPIIDACMRALHQEGWINFRMRAMLISFASYQLWLHWRKPAQHLARLFIDFEPGIHFSQVQMQSGVTGINAIRIYSPLKQSMDQDPTGAFIRKYCPELKEIDDQYIHEPHLMPPLLQQMVGFQVGRDYPEPIIEHKKAYKEAKDKIFNWRRKISVKSEAKKVYEKHGSRKNNFFPAQNRERAFGNFQPEDS